MQRNPCHLKYIILELISGMQVAGTMTWVSAGPAGIFAINGQNVYFLQNSRGVVFPSSDLVSQASWIQVL